MDSRWEPAVYKAWEPFIPQRSLWIGPSDPLVHFVRWALEYRVYLSLLCGLRQSGSVLELGCGHGRTMLGLVGYLNWNARYEGLDINAEQIDFAQRNIHGALPMFNFTHADIFHPVYNPAGKERAEGYRFPYDDASFDVVYAASVFTHLLPAAIENYFRESQRVLKKGAKCLFSVFILDYYGGPGSSMTKYYEFQHNMERGVGAVHDDETPEKLVAYRKAYIEQAACNAGLEVVSVIPGFWSCTQAVCVNEQDLVLLRRI